jgi:tRNA A37 threonylcarbamoyltransferase TsaD
MYLFLSAQDIKSCEIGVLDEGGLIKHLIVEARPEEYLKNIHEAADKWEIDLGKINKIIVVTGPGSFTSTRIIVSIANAIGFATNNKVIGIKNDEYHSLPKILEKEDWKNIINNDTDFAEVHYNRGPGITKRKKGRY